MHDQRQIRRSALGWKPFAMQKHHSSALNHKSLRIMGLHTKSRPECLNPRCPAVPALPPARPQCPALRPHQRLRINRRSVRHQAFVCEGKHIEHRKGERAVDDHERPGAENPDALFLGADEAFSGALRGWMILQIREQETSAGWRLKRNTSPPSTPPGASAYSNWIFASFTSFFQRSYSCM